MSTLSLPFNSHHSKDRPLYAVAESHPRAPPRTQPPLDALIASERLSSRADHASGFFKALCERYRPATVLVPSLGEENTSSVIPPPLPVDWTRKELSPQRRKPHKPLPAKFRGDVLQKTIYNPYGKWAWTAGLPFRDSEPGILLSSGVMCSAFLKTGKIGDWPVKYVSKVWPTKEKWHGFFSELALYKVQLKALQGRVVPAIINVYSSAGAVSVAMEPPHHSFWVEASADMPHVLKKRCVQAFEKLHACGVYHGDIELRHMLIGGDARVTIIDFQASRALVPNAAVQLEGATPDELRMEMRKVRFKLDYEGARAWEDEKLMRAARLARRNRESGAREGPLEEDKRDPPIDSREWNLEWIGAPVEPARFVMPGQSAEDLERAVGEFFSTVEKLEAEEAHQDGEAPRPRKRSPEFKPPATVPPKPTGAPSAGLGFGATVVRRPTTREPGALKRKSECDRSQESSKRVRVDGVPPPPIKARDFAHPSTLPPLPHPCIEVRTPATVGGPLLPSPGKRKRTTDDASEDTETRGRPKMRTALSCDVSSSPRASTPAGDETMNIDVPPKSAASKTATNYSRAKDASFGVATPGPPVLFRWIETLWRFVY
ncbi:hypothetical protein B0H11DRAFT_2241189 [Mycena galericulata]|nr:hypothetical protein B0H11DRAFT_2241189 [Mycena galericulata]